MRKDAMHISFDLDGTLIPHNDEFTTEPIGLLGKLFGVEKLRKGTPALFRKLKGEGHQCHIYTTSFRSTFRIRMMLAYYGVSAGKVINEEKNRQLLSNQNVNASKYPPAFGFELHVDDLEGVGMEGEKLGFKTIIISPNEEDWLAVILGEVQHW